MTARTPVIAAALGLTLAAEAAMYVVLIRHTDLPHAQLLASITPPVWLLAVWLLSRLRLAARPVMLLVLGVSAALQLIALTQRPTTTDDDYRYIWDATVQLSGTDPYRYAPSAPQLSALRDGSLYGAPDHCQYPFPGGCTNINRPAVHTIYPPVAEAAFVLARVASFGGHGGHRPMQLAGLLGSLLIAWLLLRWALARGRPWLAAVWAWCPLVVSEYANNAHVDWLAVLLVVAAFATGIRRRTGWAAALVGAAIAVKLYPALVLPALMRRRPVLVVSSALGLVVATYVPHVLAVGSAVVGYLPGYLHEENYGNGKRLLLLGAVLPAPLDTIVGVLVLGGVALWAWRRGDPEAPERAAVILVGTAFLVFTPSYGWYAGLLLALAAMTGALEWVPIVFAAQYAFLVHSDNDTLIYAVAAALALVIALVRHRVDHPALRRSAATSLRDDQCGTVTRTRRATRSDRE